MISRYDAWLNGKSLQMVNPLIYVEDISYRAVELNRSIDARTGYHGSYHGHGYIESAHVDITFLIEEYSTVERQNILQEVVAWATQEGWLATSDRPNQRLRVVCDVFPAILSAKRWTETLTMTFSAYELPFWQDLHPTEASVSAASETEETVALFCPGTFPAPLEAVVTPSASITTLTIAVGESEIELSGLSGTDAITISYSEDRHILSINQGSTSVLSKRTADSSDDLILTPGINNTISIEGDAALTATFRVRGLTV